VAGGGLKLRFISSKVFADLAEFLGSLGDIKRILELGTMDIQGPEALRPV
jgi:hypothetical protein